MATTDSELLATTDAMVWAQAFVERFAGRNVGADDLDTDLFLTWFAVAIETGRDAGRVVGQERNQTK